MDKSWMNLHRLDPRFKDGVDKFLDFAFSKTREDTIPCPCKKCANRYPLKRDIVESHMIVKGILPNYVNWTRHGEPYVSPWQATPEVASVGSSDDGMHGLIEDAMGPLPHDEGDEFDEPSGVAKKFFAATRKRKDGTFSDEKAKKAVEQMAEIEEQYTEEDGTCSVDTAEIVAAVVGPYKKGRRRLHGRTEPKPKRGDICQATLQLLREEMRAEMREVMREEMREMNRQWDARVREAQEEARREVRREREQHQSQFPESVQAALAMLLATLLPHLRVPSSSGSQPGTGSSGRPTEDGGQQ